MYHFTCSYCGAAFQRRKHGSGERVFCSRACGAYTSLSHNASHTKEYRLWSAMVQRCTNPANSRYWYYGGRGITVCERWLAFANFLADMGPRPLGLTLERRNNDGPYDPANCRWASQSEQLLNTRRSLGIIMEGHRVSLREAAGRLGIKYGTLRGRRRAGWSVEKTLHTPLRLR